MARVAVPPPDLVMRVKIVHEQGRSRLSFTLNWAGGAVREVPGDFFESDAEQYRDRLLKTLESPSMPREEVIRRLESIGQNLWRELIPEDLKRAYREIRDQVTSWMIVSDEPWIPWELIKPHGKGRSGEPFNDEFLGLRYQLTRWLAGADDPAPRIAVRQATVLLADEKLPSAAKEAEFLEVLAQSRGVDLTRRVVASPAEVVSCLEDVDLQLLHVVGHGRRDSSRSEEGLILTDDLLFGPSELEGSLAIRLRALRPLVFLNACWAGRERWSLTRLGGWASRWVKVCGCGALVAPIWPVRDSVAFELAAAFYSALDRGDSLGKAIQAARRQAFAKSGGDPSALAYSVYGHPNGRVTFGGEVGETESEPERLPLPPVDWKVEALHSLRRKRSESRVKKWWLPIAALVVFGCVSLVLYDSKVEPFKNTQFVLPRPQAKVPIHPSNPPNPPTSVSAGQSKFMITAAAGAPKAALLSALRSQGARLEEAGISGWTLQIDVPRPQISANNLSGFPEQSCRLVAHLNARSSGRTLSLDDVEAVASQQDAETACTFAAEALGRSIVDRFARSVRKENT